MKYLGFAFLTLALSRPVQHFRAYALSAPADPVRLSDASHRSSAPKDCRQAVEHNPRPLATHQVWLSSARFFTREEMVRNGDGIAYNRGKVARADADDSAKVLPPNAEATVAVILRGDCVFDHDHGHFFIHVQRVTFGMLAALFPDQLIAGLRKMVEETSYESAGPFAERIARLREIAREREQLHQQHAALVDEAVKQGLNMEHLPAEKARRAAAADRQRAHEYELRMNRSYYRDHPGEKPAPPDAT